MTKHDIRPSRPTFSVVHSAMQKAVQKALHKQWLTLCVTFASVCFSACLMSGAALATNRITVTADETVRTLFTTSNDVREVLSGNGIEIGPDDVLLVDNDENDSHKISAEVLRAFSVTVTAARKVSTVQIAQGTVADVLKHLNIVPDEDDIVSPSLNMPVTPDTEIVYKNVEQVSVEEQEVLPFETTVLASEEHLKGTTVLSHPGQDGLRRTVTLQTYVDGELTASQVTVNETIPPVNKVVLEGTKHPLPENAISSFYFEDAPLDANGVPQGYSKVITGKSAAYSARPGASTASGRPAIVGHVAVDPSIIPYGTRLYIKSTDSNDVYGYCIAADTGTALLDGRIIVDLFFGSYESSCDWAVHQVAIYVLDE